MTIMMYRPPFEDGFAMTERLTAKYHKELASLKLDWIIEEIEGYYQPLPVVLIDFKGVF